MQHIPSDTVQTPPPVMQSEEQEEHVESDEENKEEYDILSISSSQSVEYEDERASHAHPTFGEDDQEASQRFRVVG